MEKKALVCHRGHACVVVRTVSVSRMTRPQTRARTTHVRAFAMEYFPSHAGGDRAAYPAAFHGAALALDEAATAKVGFSFPAELLEAVLAFNDWCDFY